jgi:hypothetical protein
MTKMWLIVVLMALTSPQPSTPAYVPFVYFESLQQCREYVLTYKDLLFTESVKKYQGIYFPERAVCVDQDMFRKMFFGKDPRIIEEDL